MISDEIYLRIAYGERARSVLELVPDRERMMLVNGVAKAYAMTGWRIGWAIAPRAVAAAMTALQSHTTSNPATVSQHAALAALTEAALADAAIGSMVSKFQERRDAAVALLAAAGVPHVRPDGAFYLYVDVATDGDAFTTRLLDSQGVAVVPGSAFLTPNWVRASYAAPVEIVLEGVRRLVRALTGERGEPRRRRTRGADRGGLYPQARRCCLRSALGQLLSILTFSTSELCPI